MSWTERQAALLRGMGLRLWAPPRGSRRRQTAEAQTAAPAAVPGTGQPRRRPQPPAAAAARRPRRVDGTEAAAPPRAAPRRRPVPT